MDNWIFGFISGTVITWINLTLVEYWLHGLTSKNSSDDEMR